MQAYNAVHRSTQLSSSRDNYLTKLVKLNTADGLKLRGLKFVWHGTKGVYSNFDQYDTNLANTFPNYTIFFEFAKTFSTEFYNRMFILNYVYSLIELVFIIKKSRTKKKKKKPSTKIIIKYLPKRARTTLTLRLINMYIKTYNERHLNKRIENGLFYLSLAGKSSFLYQKKLGLYSKLLEKRKFL